MQVSAVSKAARYSIVRNARPAEERRRILGRMALALCAFWGAVAVLVVEPQLPDNALDVPGAAAVEPHLRAVTPQGWAFFTRSPREPKLTAWRHDGGAWEPALLGPHAEPRNAFGFDRASRAQPVEAAILNNRVPEKAWIDCGRADLPRCLERPGAVTRVGSTGPSPTLCGRVALVVREPWPWAWARGAPDGEMPARTARLEVEC